MSSSKSRTSLLSATALASENFHTDIRPPARQVASSVLSAFGNHRLSQMTRFGHLFKSASRVGYQNSAQWLSAPLNGITATWKDLGRGELSTILEYPEAVSLEDILAKIEQIKVDYELYLGRGQYLRLWEMKPAFEK